MGLKGLRTTRREQAVGLILHAAAEVFAENGYSGTSMEQIARRVDCAPATLYGYFKGKAQIFGRIWQEKSDEYLDGVAATVGGADDFDEAFGGYFDHFEKKLHSEPDFVRLLITVLRSHDLGAFPDGEAHQAQNVRYIGLITDVMQRGIQEGRVAPRPPELLAVAFLGMLHATVYAWMLAGGQEPIKPLLDNVRSLFLGGATEEVYE